MKIYAVVLAMALAVAACSRLTEDNFSKVQVGMTEQEVSVILGSPGESDSVNILGVSGTAWRWKSGNTVASVQFVNGKVAAKIWEKPKKAN